MSGRAVNSPVIKSRIGEVVLERLFMVENPLILERIEIDCRHKLDANVLYVFSRETNRISMVNRDSVAHKQVDSARYSS